MPVVMQFGSNPALQEPEHQMPYTHASLTSISFCHTDLSLQCMRTRHSQQLRA